MLAFRLHACVPCAMDDCTLAGFLARHPEVDAAPCPVDGNWHATVSLDCGYGYVHGETEADLLAKLTADLGG